MPGLICLREKLWTRTYSVGDQVPTCPVFTRAKIKSRFGILVNFVVTNIYNFNFKQLNPVDGSYIGRPWCQRHGSGRVWFVSGLTSNHRGGVLQALTLLGGVRFIAWRLTGHEAFWSRRTFLSYRPAPRPILKRPCATLVRMVGQSTNTVQYI